MNIAEKWELNMLLNLIYIKNLIRTTFPGKKFCLKNLVKSWYFCIKLWPMKVRPIEYWYGCEHGRVFMCFACLMKLYVSVYIYAVVFLTICVLLFKVINVKVQCFGHL